MKRPQASFHSTPLSICASTVHVFLYSYDHCLDPYTVLCKVRNWWRARFIRVNKCVWHLTYQVVINKIHKFACTITTLVINCKLNEHGYGYGHRPGAAVIVTEGGQDSQRQKRQRHRPYVATVARTGNGHRNIVREYRPNWMKFITSCHSPNCHYALYSTLTANAINI